MALKTNLIEYFDGSTCLEGYFAYDDSRSNPAPSVLISHAWGGRDEFVCEKARKLVDLGYAALALDMYGKGILGKSTEENTKLMQTFMEDRSLLQNRMRLALQTLKDQPQVDENQIAAMGFCFGGLCVLDLARIGEELKSVISFHGLFIPPKNIQGNRIKAKVLALHGYNDPMVPIDSVVALQEELTKAGADWQVHSYGNTLHAFTNPQANDPNFGTVYSASADRRSWQTMQNFLKETLS